jgi:hypothetical protein
MSSDERRPEDGQWIERVRDAWQAPAQTPNQRAAFDDRFEERMEQRSRRQWLRPVGILATAALAAALLWNAALMPTPTPTEAPLMAEATTAPATRAEIADAWIEFGDEAYAVGAAYSANSSEAVDALDASLPDDYAAIESLLFGS